uniref:SFRICE_000038 n=1 Tax=Spodoptera frugiperda TaxID=7108 RepID=A0A2H1V424_SPOFR
MLFCLPKATRASDVTTEERGNDEYMCVLRSIWVNNMGDCLVGRVVASATAGQGVSGGAGLAMGMAATGSGGGGERSRMPRSAARSLTSLSLDNNSNFCVSRDERCSISWKSLHPFVKRYNAVSTRLSVVNKKAHLAYFVPYAPHIARNRRPASALHPAARVLGLSSSRSARRFVPTTLAPEDANFLCLPRAGERDPPHRSVMFVTLI